MTITSACADFTLGLKLDHAPEDAIKWAKWAILDCTGAALAGAATELGGIIREYMEFIAGKPQTRIVGLGLRTSATEAALAGGALAHALDFDDTGGGGHPSATLLPAIYALADVVHPTGKEVLEAYIVGFEVGNCLANRSSLGKIDKTGWQLGWHPAGPYGAMRAVCAAARLLRLNREQVQYAIGITASEASGIHKNFGTMTKPLHAGLAARNGVMAALLAQRGFTADPDALGGDQGFLRAFKGPGNYTEEAVCSKLGKSYALERGIGIKRYPACWSTHRATAAVIDLVQEHNLTPADIETIELDLRLFPLLHVNPTNGLQGKFSMAFNVALGVLKGLPEIEDYTAVRTQEPAIRSIMNCIRHVDDPSDGSVNVVIRTKDGRRFDKNRMHAPGDPSFGLQEQSALEKFRRCAAYRLQSVAIAKAEQALLHLEEVTDFSRVLDFVAENIKDQPSANKSPVS